MFVGSGWSAGGLVVAAGVELELAEDFAGRRVDDADVEVVDQESGVGSGVGSPDADVVQSTVVAQRDDTGFVDLVGPDSIVGVLVAVGAGGGFGSGFVGRGGGAVLG